MVKQFEGVAFERYKFQSDLETILCNYLGNYYDTYLLSRKALYL